MPCLNLTGGEPWAETLGVMLFPDHELKRRAVIATLWAGFYPKYEEAGFEPLPRSVLLSIMQASTAARVEKAEMDRGWYHARIAGEQLKVLAAIAAVDPRRASWKMATRIVAHHTGSSRALLYQARRRFMPVIHLWTAFILRGERIDPDPSCNYTALDDVQVFITEAMALFQWARHFKLDRAKAEPVLNCKETDFWVPPPSWSPPIAKPGWPRDGRLLVPRLADECLPELRAKRWRRSQKNLSTGR